MKVTEKRHKLAKMRRENRKAEKKLKMEIQKQYEQEFIAKLRRRPVWTNTRYKVVREDFGLGLRKWKS